MFETFKLVTSALKNYYKVEMRQGKNLMENGPLEILVKGRVA